MKQSALVFTALCLSLLLCLPSLGQITGNGNVVKESRNHSGFTGIQVGGAFDVIITQGSTYRVVIEADDNVLSQIQTRVEGNTLKITTKGHFKNVKEMNAYITLPEMDHLDISGACDVEGQSTFRTNKMDLGLSGASDVSLKIDVDQLDCGISGSADLNISGSADNVQLGISGSGDFKGEELHGSTAKVGISGSGSAKIHLSQGITAAVSGAGDITVFGNPSSRKVQTSGAGDVRFAAGGQASPSKSTGSGKVY